MRDTRNSTPGRQTLFITALAGLLCAAPSSAEDCENKSSARSVTSDLGSAVGTCKSKRVDVAKTVALGEDAAALAEQVENHINMVNQIGAINLQMVTQLAETLAKQDKNALLAAGPQDWNDIPFEQRLMLRAAIESLFGEVRNALRNGTTPAIFDATDLSVAGTPAGLKDILRINQELQNRGLPTQFGGYSPQSVTDLQGLVGLADGETPNPKTAPTAFGLLFNATEGPDQLDVLVEAQRSGKAPSGAVREGIPGALPSATSLAERLRELQRQRVALERELGNSVQVPELDALTRQLEQLEEVAEQVYSAAYERLGGIEELLTYEPPDLSSSLGGTLVPLELYSPTGSSGGTTGAGSTTGTGSETGGGDASTEELVSIRDTLNLLGGNGSGYTLANVPITPALRFALGLTTQQAEVPNPSKLNIDEIFQPKLKVLRQANKLDQAAFIPAAQRGEYLLERSSEAYARSLREQGRTELTEEFDNTVLNRVVEATDLIGMAFKGDDPQNWIGARSRIYLGAAENMQGRVEKLTDEALTAVLAGRHGETSSKIREAIGIGEQQADMNSTYILRAEETEFETGMTIAFLPFAVAGWVDDAAKIGRKVGTKLQSRSMSKLARGAKFADETTSTATRTVTKATNSMSETASLARRTVCPKPGTATKAAQVTRRYTPPSSQIRQYSDKFVVKAKGERLPKFAQDGAETTRTASLKKIEAELNDVGLGPGELIIDDYESLVKRAKEHGFNFEDSGELMGLNRQNDIGDFIPTRLQVTGSNGNVSPAKSLGKVWGQARSGKIANDSAARAAARRTLAVEEAIEAGSQPTGIYHWSAWGDTREQAFKRLDGWRTFYTLEKLQMPGNPTALGRARLFDALIRWNF